jgi:hypothetical protein
MVGRVMRLIGGTSDPAVDGVQDTLDQFSRE